MSIGSMRKFIERIGPEAVKTLMSQRTVLGWTPMHVALAFMRPDICHLFHEFGGDLLEPEPETGLTALHYIARKALADPRNERVKRWHSWDDRHWKWYHDGCVQLRQQYLSSGGRVDVPDGDGLTPLMHFLSAGLEAAGEHTCSDDILWKAFLVLAQEATLNTRAKDGKSALHVLAAHPRALVHIPNPFKIQDRQCTEMFEYLVNHGADPYWEDNDGRSSIDVATLHGNGGIVTAFARQAAGKGNGDGW